MTSVDKAQWVDVYRRLEKPLYNVVYRVIFDSAESQDVVQETFLRCWRRKEDIRADGFKALLFDQPLIGASADKVLLRIADFVYVSGGFSFNKGPVHEVDVLTHLTQAQAAGVLGSLMLPPNATGEDPGAGTTAATADGSIIWNLPVQTIEVGLTGVDVFVGYAPDGVLEAAASNGKNRAREMAGTSSIRSTTGDRPHACGTSAPGS